MPPWSPGDAIAWRLRIRTRPSAPWGDLSYVFPLTVVRDDDEIVLLRRPGYVAKRRNAELLYRFAMRPMAVAWRDGFTDEVFHKWRMLITKRPRDEHAITLVWEDATDEFVCWYIDLTSPLRRSRVGFDLVEHGLDIVVRADLSSWRWKDEAELDWAVEHGLYTDAEARALRAEGERAVRRLTDERERFERWRAWRPDRASPVATLPPGWDRGV